MWQQRSEPPDGPALAVAELTQQIKSVLQADFAQVKVVGEIADLARPRSGHIYLTLKDPNAQLKAVIWRSTAQSLAVDLSDGLEVVAWGRIDLYLPRGTYQLIVEGVEALGAGALERALRKLREKLSKEGLFDAKSKKVLPPFPARIAVITSPTSAALRDFLEVLRRRWNQSQVWILPAQMQGEDAAPQVIAALQRAHRLKPRPDVIVVTRGGGSIEDLWAFNDERLVRAIFAAEIPVVSAIGHEIDVTLADLVADLRALTPSEAAERIVPSRQDYLERLAVDAGRLQHAMKRFLAQARMRVESIASRPVFRDPLTLVYERQQAIDEWQRRLRVSGGAIVVERRRNLDHLRDRLEALNPLAVLSRGYSITTSVDCGKVVRDASDVADGAMLRTILARGELLSRKVSGGNGASNVGEVSASDVRQSD